MTRKLSFLPLFFVVLGSVFAAAVFIRVRSYQATADLPATVTRGGEEQAATTRSNVPATDSGELVDYPADMAADTGTITETSPDLIAARTAREQRYNELLRAAPPGAPVAPKPPPEEKSLLERIVTPIANALGVKEKEKEKEKPPVPTPPPPSRSPRDRQLPQAPDTPDNPVEERPPTEEDQPPTDEESDTRPPQLQSIEFQPPEVTDDSETVLVATVIDDLSGVRSVSGVIISPATVMQGFAGQREPETNRYIARIRIPPQAAEGVWKVNYIALSDHAGNNINLTASQGMLPPSAQFRVTSARSDSKAPTLINVRVARDNMAAGEKNIVYVEAEDDKSGMWLVSGVFVSPSKSARVGFGCKAAQGGTTSWECDFTPPANADCGQWQLEQLQLQDNARNMASLRGDQPAIRAVQINISGQGCDSKPPVLSSLMLNPTLVSNAEGGRINVTAAVSDDISGVGHINGYAYGPQGPNGPKFNFSMVAGSDGQTWIGTIIVPKNAAAGTWSIGWVHIVDKAQNPETYTDKHPVLANAKFQVE